MDEIFTIINSKFYSNINKYKIFMTDAIDIEIIFIYFL